MNNGGAPDAGARPELIVPPGHEVRIYKSSPKPHCSKTLSGVWIADFGQVDALAALFAAVEKSDTLQPTESILWIVQEPECQRIVDNTALLSAFLRRLYAARLRGMTPRDIVFVSGAAPQSEAMRLALHLLGLPVYTPEEDGSVWAEVKRPDGTVCGLTGGKFVSEETPRLADIYRERDASPDPPKNGRDASVAAELLLLQQTKAQSGCNAAPLCYSERIHRNADEPGFLTEADARAFFQTEPLMVRLENVPARAEPGKPFRTEAGDNVQMGATLVYDSLSRLLIHADADAWRLAQPETAFGALPLPGAVRIAETPPNHGLAIGGFFASWFIPALGFVKSLTDRE